MLSDCIADPRVAHLRSRIEVIADPGAGSDQAEAEVVLADGRTLQARVTHAPGSKAHQMTDADLDAKFRSQAGLVLPAARVEKLRGLCIGAASLLHVGREISAVLD
jgi:2-methylcitrate dehydratase PrpD